MRITSNVFALFSLQIMYSGWAATRIASPFSIDVCNITRLTCNFHTHSDRSTHQGQRLSDRRRYQLRIYFLSVRCYMRGHKWCRCHYEQCSALTVFTHCFRGHSPIHKIWTRTMPFWLIIFESIFDKILRSSGVFEEFRFKIPVIVV